ncbi:MAG: H-X9-DG-CTERM domain-containing protein [Limisphaerales bacterium]
MDARETEPQMVLSGDRNLALAGKSLGPGLVSLATNSVVGWTQEIHPDGGNICLADGSVQLVTEARLRDQLRQGGSTNRVAIP